MVVQACDGHSDTVVVEGAPRRHGRRAGPLLSGVADVHQRQIRIGLAEEAAGVEGDRRTGDVAFLRQDHLLQGALAVPARIAPSFGLGFGQEGEGGEAPAGRPRLTRGQHGDRQGIEAVQVARQTARGGNPGLDRRAQKIAQDRDGVRATRVRDASACDACGHRHSAGAGLADSGSQRRADARADRGLVNTQDPPSGTHLSSRASSHQISGNPRTQDESMRASPALLAGLALLAAGPAMAQSSRALDSLNATNDRLSNRSEIRGIEQRQQFNDNQMRMQMDRGALFRPSAPAAPMVVPGRR